MKQICILMVLGSTEMGGAQMFILNLMRNLDRERFQVDVVVNKEVKDGGIGDELRALGCRIYLLPYFKVYNYISFVRRWKRFLGGHHYDIVHGHATNSASVYLKIAKEAGCVTIAHSHSAGYRGNGVEQLVKRYFAHRIGPVADYWFACSDKAAERLYGREFRIYERYYSIPNAINAEDYRYDIDKAKAFRRQLGVADNELLCGHVGSFTVPKNHGFLLDIFAEVLKQRTDARLVCCGAGELMAQVREKAEALGIMDKMILTGNVMNVNDYLMAMDIMVFPSLFEGFPIAVIEAEAAGLPVVMSDVITKEVDLTDLVHRHALSDSADIWAKTICCIKTGQRTEYNKVIADSEYNMQSCVKLITSLYEEMARFN